MTNGIKDSSKDFLRAIFFSCYYSAVIIFSLLPQFIINNHFLAGNVNT